LARDVVWDNSVHPKDAIHVATSAADKIAEFHTFDDPLLSKKIIDVAGFIVTISRPHGTGAIPLPGVV
jgi:predicted nucleic acid-binding protein